MAKWLQKEAHQLDIDLVANHPGFQSPGVKLPPILVGHYPKVPIPEKKTILIYGHYDVQPASIEDGWEADPFTVVEKPDGKMVGRGITDDKGPVIGWLNAIEAYQA